MAGDAAAGIGETDRRQKFPLSPVIARYSRFLGDIPQ
jgi:hypothetical protein